MFTYSARCSLTFRKGALPVSRRLQQNQSSFLSTSITDLVRPITVNTCLGLYPRLQQKHPRIFPLKVPATGGVSLTVQYADTANDRLKRPDHHHHFEKTIVAVPGCPGYISHFDWLLAHYRSSPTVRVIALNLPDFNHTRSSGGLFWHTTEEKVAFLRDFLRQLGVHRVDCLVAHSMGFHTVTGLVESCPSDITVASLALFAPQPSWDMTPPMRSFVERLFTFRTDRWYRLLERLKVHQSRRIAIRFDTIDEFLWLMTTVRDELTPLDAYRRIYHLRHRRQSTLPVVVQYGSREPIVSRRAARRLFAEFGLGDNKLIEYDMDDRRPPAEIVGPVDGGSFPLVRGFLARGGGHFAFAKSANVSLQMIEQLLHYQHISGD